MAGGGSLGGDAKPKRGASGKRKKMKRISFHLDMTPLVDITFLLLTFFMFTTTMAAPQVMEMKIPPETTGVDVKESELLSIFVDDSSKVFWFKGTEEPKEIKMNKVKELSVRENVDMKNKLITVLKIHEKTPYGVTVKILDELNLAEAEITEELAKETDPETGKPMERSRKFTIAKMEEEDIAKLKGEETDE